MDAINIDNLKKSYGTKSILENFSMEVKEGEIYGLLGPNGSGKSTLMRIILELLPYEEGEITLFGLDHIVGTRTLSRKINALPEFFELYGWMQSLEYLRFFAAIYDIYTDDVRLKELLRDVGLDPDDKKSVGEYSQGMKKRLGLARALINDPKLLILDEPTNGLDPKGRREIHDLLLELNRKKGTTIMLSTHILDDVERLCSRIGILYEKKLQYEGPLLQSESKSHYRYRFELTDPAIKLNDCNSTHIQCTYKEDQWIECEIDGIEPYKAIKELLERDIHLNQAVSLAGSLEYLYFSMTKEHIS